MKKGFALICVCILLCTIVYPVVAHSGGTDSDGGHYDHASGEYHYHHGYPAHRHTNGICPYTEREYGSDPETGTIVFWCMVAIGSIILLVVLCKSKKAMSFLAVVCSSSGMISFFSLFIFILSSENIKGGEKILTTGIVTAAIFVVTFLVLYADIKRIRRQTATKQCAADDKSKPLLNNPQNEPPATLQHNGTYIEMHPVISSNIHSIGYQSGNLYVRFHRSGVYRYIGVSKTMYDHLMQEKQSYGKFFNSYIRDRYHSVYVGNCEYKEIPNHQFIVIPIPIDTANQ